MDDALPARLAPAEEGIAALPLLEIAELPKAADTALSQSLPKGVSSVDATTSLSGFKASLRKPPELLGWEFVPEEGAPRQDKLSSGSLARC
jgi:hypothetical protein